MFAAVEPTTVDPREAAARERLQRAVGAEYEVGRLAGRGGFADVFEAREPRLDRSVAIKVVHADGGSPELLERFQREARAMAGLRHPNVMEIYTVGASDDVAYFVMPLVDGESLKSRIAREGALAVEEAMRILVDAAGALDAAHRAGTIHRDVKSDNIMLEGELGRVLITDFGIAKALGGDTSTFTRSGFVGTPHYVSPEQATGEDIDHRSDIYSLGIVAFEMVTGRLPFEARSVQALIAKHLTEEAPPLRLLRPDCPERLSRVVGRCLAKDPGARWASLSEVIAVLEGEDDPAAEVEAGAFLTARASAREPVRALQETAAVLALVTAAVAVGASMLGFGEVGAWLAVGAAGYVTARAGGLWREGYEWRDLFTGSGPSASSAAQAATKDDGSQPNFARFTSLMRTIVSDRATIMKAYASMPHRDQSRLRALQPAVDGLLARARHLAQRVVHLEARIAEVTARAERVSDADVMESSLLDATFPDRHAARLHELVAARDDAARELHGCIHRLDDLRDRLCGGSIDDEQVEMDHVARMLSDVEAYLSRRSV
jgi:serine/threonine-protein kinase